MSDNLDTNINIDVDNSTSDSIQITVNDNGNNNFSLDISGDKYYMGLAKEWAVKMDGKVASEDYSSKYYAQQAKNQADIATGAAIDVHEAITQGIQDAIDEVTEEITELGTQYTGDITTTGDNYLAQIENAQNVAKGEITELGTLYTGNIVSTGDSYLEQIESAKTDAKNEITELGTQYTGEITAAGSEYLTEFESTKSGIEKEITDLGTQYTDNIKSTGSSYLSEIENAKTDAKNEITDLGTQYTDNIENTGNSYLSQIESAKSDAQSEIEKLGTQYNDDITETGEDYLSQITAAKNEVEQKISGLAQKDDIKNGKLTIKNNGKTIAEFGANQSDNVEANIDTSELSESITELEKSVDVRKYDAMETFGMSEWVTGVVDGEKALYESLKPKNLGNPLTDETSWKKVEFNGGGSGLEVGDIGIALYVDETKGLRRRLNGSTVAINTNTQGFLNFLKGLQATTSSLFTDEDTWQSEMEASDLKQCGKFVIDEEGGTIRLPKVVNIQGVQDMAQYGMTVKAGLPNITAGIGFRTGGYEPSGACYKTGASYVSSTTTGSLSAETRFDASRSNEIYGNSETVQQEAVQYPFFIQIATRASEKVDIENEIQLNNPYSLLDVKWSDKKLNNISWLLSEGQANSMTSYPAVYELLLKEYNSATDETETIDEIEVTYRKGTETGIKIITDKSTFDSLLTKTGTAWYYVLDTANEQFYLPQSNGFMQFGGEGEYVPASLPNVKGGFGALNNSNITPSGCFKYGTSSTRNQAGSSTIQANEIEFDASLSSSIYGNSDTVQPPSIKGYLYFYVGETVQNANLIDAGRIQEQISEINTKPHIVETYVNGESWYRVWSDGWCEQGGVFDRGGNITSSAEVWITLLKEYGHTNYTAFAIPGGNTIDGGFGCYIVVANTRREISRFKCHAFITENSNRYINWVIKGRIGE